MKLLVLGMLIAITYAVPNLVARALLEERQCQTTYSCECKGHTWIPCDGMCECKNVAWCAADRTAYCGGFGQPTCPCTGVRNCNINQSGNTPGSVTCNQCCGG
ncbi:hypothetical protein V2W45_1442032 [Cenococcum geophilum]